MHVSRACAVLLALMAIVVAPLRAQSTQGSIDREHMTQYARAHRALNNARDEFHGKVGRIHDEQGRDRARVEMDEQITAALDSLDMTRDAYDEITLLISIDGDARAMFDEIMKELGEAGSDGS